MLDEGEAAPVGCHHRELSFAEAGKDAFERLARVVLRGGEGSLAEHLAEGHLRKSVCERLAVHRKRREVGDGHSSELEHCCARRDESAVIRAGVQLHHALCGLGDRVEEKLGGKSSRALALHFAVHHRADRQVEIRRGEEELLLLRLQKDVLQDLQRALRGCDVLHCLQGVKELGADYFYLHFLPLSILL